MSAAHDVGDQPGVGEFACLSCGRTLLLTEWSERLPPCPACGAGERTRYRHAFRGEAARKGRGASRGEAIRRTARA